MMAPKLSLNFVSAALDPRVTFARALATATRVNSSGLIESVAADTPRFGFALGSGGTCRGLLVEETRQNLMLNSVFANTGGAAPTGWSQQFATGTSAPAASTLSAVGAAYAQTAVAQRPYLARALTLAASTTYTMSMVIEEVSGVLFGDLLFPQGSSISSFRLNGAAVSGVSAAMPGILEATFTTTTAGSYTMRFGIGVVGGATGSVRFSCPQLELGAFATSYIPTDNVAASTRNADVATITGTAFSGFWRSGPGSILVRALPSTVSGTRPLVQVDDATADNIIALRGNTTNPELYIRSGGSDQATIDAGTISAAAYRLAGSWKAGNGVATLNGFAPVKGTPASIPAATQMRLGSDGTNYLNGHLQSLEYWDEFLTPATLQSVTTSAGYRSIVGPVMRDTIIA